MSSRTTNNPNTAPKHIVDFTKALAGEIRILLQEVGKLRDERRQLQYEIAELMAVKSKHGAGGEYAPEWRPRLEGPPPENAVAIVEDAPAPAAPARPAWRVVHKRTGKGKARNESPAPAPGGAPSHAPAPELVPVPSLPAWASWRPNPLLTPTAGQSALPTSPPPRAGLFGPSTPPPQ
jgi:hypothetical protein